MSESTKKYFYSADILLPNFNNVDGEKWSVVACDQYTSEPEYWENVEKNVGSSPSTLRLILPEVYLDESEKRIPVINAEMDEYLRDILCEHKGSMIYAERKLASGKVRHGIIGCIDLEEYDYNKGSSSLIRATEGTVLSRIPPRVAIRRGASLELPHVLMLTDDREKTVIEPLDGIKAAFDVAYDFDLMLDSGSIKGWFIPEAEQERIISALSELITPDNMKKRYGDDCAPLLFAVGDGNHSLATAKACYEELKTKNGDKAKNSKARYALVEIENLHDDALEFEPIYRVVFGVDSKELMEELKKYAKTLCGKEKPQTVVAVTANGDETLTFDAPECRLAVGTLQNFLDEYVKTHDGAEVDYIHGTDSLRKLAVRDDAIGFIFDGMEKNDLFKTVIFEGALPRKTFSMGHANDKRYYLECRKIKD